MQLFGVDLSAGTFRDFSTEFLVIFSTISVAFGARALIRKNRGENWTDTPNTAIFFLILAASLSVGNWLHKWIFQ
jgi:hypothetical protein